MTTFLHDVRYAWRVLWRAPLTSGVAVVTLALGIGAASAIFAFVNAALLTPPAGVADPGRLVTIGRTYEGDGFDNSSYPNYADLRDQNRVFSDVAAVTPAPLSLSDGGRAERKQGALVTPNYFRTLGVTFARGGGFDARIASGGDPSVAVISHAAWVQQFGGDPGIVGRLVRSTASGSRSSASPRQGSAASTPRARRISGPRSGRWGRCTSFHRPSARSTSSATATASGSCSTRG